MMLRYKKRNLYSISRRRAFFAIATLVVFSSTLILLDQTAKSQVYPLGRAANTEAKPPSCSSCPEPTLQTIYAPTIGLPALTRGKIVFNSRSDAVTKVRLTFYMAEGESVVGPEITLQPAEIRTADISSLIPEERRGEQRWGGMTLSYTGKVYDIWAQIMLLGDNHSGSTDVTFSVLNGLGSSRQEAVWLMPARGRAIIALGNSSSAPLQTKVNFSNGESQVVNIEPFATEYIRPRAGIGNNARDLLNGRGESVLLNTVGLPGSLKAVGLVMAADGRLLSSIRFYDTQNVVQPHLFATNMRLRGYTPRIVLKNTSATPVTASPRFLPVSGEGGSPVELPPVTLGPEEVTELNLDPLVLAAADRLDLDAVSVQIINSGAPGSLIGAINGQKIKSGETYDVPLRDSGINRSNSGAYPWRIDGDFTTVASVTNVGDKSSRFISELYYSGGKYLFGPRTIEVGETAVFDIKKIRDERLPDANGDFLPSNITSGQFRWHRYPAPGTAHMIGRAAVSSASNRISASYSCLANCGAHGPDYWVYGNTNVLVNGYRTMNTKERWYGASGGYNEYNTNLSGAVMDNTAVASLSNFSSGWVDVNGLSQGDTFWWWSYWYGYEYDDGFDCRYAQEEYTDGEPTTVLPTITVGSVSLNRTSVSTAQNAVLSITLTASSGLTVSNTDNVTLQVGIANASRNFQLGFGPSMADVTLSPGQSKVFNFNVSVVQGPTAPATCNLIAIVSNPSTIAVLNNNAASSQLIVN